MIKLSVIIVNWNRKELLKQILIDIKNQSFENFEIIIVDNGSTDGAIDIPAEIGIDCLHIKLHKNYGLSVGRNIGIMNSRGDYLFIPDNDLRLPDKCLFEKAVIQLDNSDYGIISCFQYKNFEEYGEFNRESNNLNYSYWFFYGGACFYKKKIFKVIGFFDDYFSYGGEEWDLVFKLARSNIQIAKNDSLAIIHKPHDSSRKNDYKLMIITNMLIAELRYLPMTDFLVLLLWQSFIVLIRSLKRFNIFLFVKYIFHIAKNFKSQVLQKRLPLEKHLINKFYALRINALSKDFSFTSLSLIAYYRNKLFMKSKMTNVRN